MKKIISFVLAMGIIGITCFTHSANADKSALTNYKATINASLKGETVALLDGEIASFALNYSKGCSKSFAEEDFLRDRYFPKATEISWTNSREGVLYYTFSIGLEKDLSDATSYVVFESKINLENLFTAKHYYYQINAHYENDEVVKSIIYDFHTADTPRTIYIEGVNNTRDLGGRFTEDGKYQIKQGMIYRGGHADNITEEGKNVLLNVLGVKTDVDLRGGLTVSPIDPSLNYVCVSGPYYFYGLNTDPGIHGPAYKTALATELRAFANSNNYPIYLHCSLGRDRAGTLSFLLGALLGMSEEDLYRDYETSFFSINGFPNGVGVMEINNLLIAFNNLYGFLKSYHTGTLAENTERFCILYLGLTKAEVDSIRNIMWEEIK